MSTSIHPAIEQTTNKRTTNKRATDERPSAGQPSTSRTFTSVRTLAASMLAVMAIGATACGGSAPLVAPVAPPPEQSASPAPAADQAAAPDPASTSASAVSEGSSSFGPILVGNGGLTVYGFTNDQNGASVCTGTCAAAWPPVIVGPDWNVAPGLDAGIFNTTTRDDGTLQLVAGKWPLYYYGGDVVAGDVNGQGNGDVWFVVGTDGVLIQDAATAASPESAAPAGGSGEAPIAKLTTDAGEVLVDSTGLSLYGFLEDEGGRPTCLEACADAWPPLLVPSPEVPAGLDPNVYSVVPTDAGFQLKAGTWPLYRFAGDAAPGDINGQGSGDVWFLVRTDGSLVRDGDGTNQSGNGY